MPFISSEYDHILQRAVDEWGEDPQIDQAIEEMAELTQALIKYRRRRKTSANTANILEECADVALSLRQLLIIFGTQGFQIMLKVKAHRLDTRLKTGLWPDRHESRSA